MNRVFTVLFFIFIASKLYAQKVEVLYRMPNYKPAASIADFRCISEYMEVYESTKVATLRAVSTNTGKNTLVRLYGMLWETANKLGGNSFLVEKVENSTADSVAFTVAIHLLSATELSKNDLLFKRNMLYVFGELNAAKQERKQVVLNSTKMDLPVLQYISYVCKPDETTTISMDSPIAAVVTIQAGYNIPARYFSLKGYRVKPGEREPTQVKAVPGNIYEHDNDFARFLIKVLKEKK